MLSWLIKLWDYCCLVDKGEEMLISFAKSVPSQEQVQAWVKSARQAHCRDISDRQSIEEGALAIERWLSGSTMEKPTLIGHFKKVIVALQHEAAQIMLERELDSDRRHALLYVLYRLHIMDERLVYPQGDIQRTYDIQPQVMDRWVEWGITQGYIEPSQGAYGGRGNRPIRITTYGRDYIDQLIATLKVETVLVSSDLWTNYPEDQLAELVPLLARKTFDREIEIGIKAASASSPITLLFADIDHFGSVNNIHGHQKGDQILIGVAKILRQTVGRRGKVYRYGGEEFTVLLPDFSTSEAAALAERVRFAVANQTWENLPEIFRVTISIGVAQYPSEGILDTSALIQGADDALYRAKREGRNRVCSKDSLVI